MIPNLDQTLHVVVPMQDDPDQPARLRVIAFNADGEPLVAPDGGYLLTTVAEWLDQLGESDLHRWYFGREATP